MNIVLPPGRYVVAVSGGVDSVVLLDLARRLPGVRLTVAHFDHGIRPDSAADAGLVRRLARTYGLPCVTARAELGPGASEAVARQARYGFLRQARQVTGARAIVTAHHQDDVLETAIFNIVRGSGRRGLSSLHSTNLIARPLLHFPKSALLAYARTHGLEWREDSTNTDQKYARNYIRHSVLSRFSQADRQKLLAIISDISDINDRIDADLGHLVPTLCHKVTMPRKNFITLPYAVAKEVMATWLRQNGLTEIDAKLLERLVHAAKTYRPHSQVHATKNWLLNIGTTNLALGHIER